MPIPVPEVTCAQSDIEATMESPRPSIIFSPLMKWLAAACTLALGYMLYTAVHDVALVFFGAAVFAYIFSPIVDFAAPYLRQSRVLATSLLFVLMAAVCALIVAQLGPLVTSQYKSLRADLPNALAVLDSWSFVVAGTEVPAGAHIKELVAKRVLEIPASLPSLVVTVIHGFLHLLAFLITSFFLMMNGKQVVRTILNLYHRRIAQKCAMWDDTSMESYVATSAGRFC